MAKKTLVLSEEKAKELYPKSSPEWQEVLNETFGKKTFVTDICDRVVDFKTACDELGRTEEEVMKGAADDYERAERAIKTFAEAMREGKPASECFYYPYFYIAGVGFSFSDFGCDYSRARVGARLRVDSSKKAIHHGKCMESYYKTMLTGN